MPAADLKLNGKCNINQAFLFGQILGFADLCQFSKFYVNFQKVSGHAMAWPLK